MKNTVSCCHSEISFFIKVADLDWFSSIPGALPVQLNPINCSGMLFVLKKLLIRFKMFLAVGAVLCDLQKRNCFLMAFPF